MRFKGRFGLILATLALLLGNTGRTHAAVIVPFGVQNSVALSTVTGAWGWTEIYRGGYGDVVSMATAFSGAGQYLMLAGIQDGSGTIDVLAAALTSDVLLPTGADATHAANGSEWYFNSLSMGFAGLGSAISQNSADTNDAPGFGGIPANGLKRLSWHTSGPSLLAPDTINGGWRSGNTTFLNSEPSGWDRIVFTANASAAVPEPTSFALLGAAAAGYFGMRRRKRATTV